MKKCRNAKEQAQKRIEKLPISITAGEKITVEQITGIEASQKKTLAVNMDVICLSTIAAIAIPSSQMNVLSRIWAHGEGGRILLATLKISGANGRLANWLKRL